MPHLAVVINRDPILNDLIKQCMGRIDGMVTETFQDEMKALDWIRKDSRAVDILMLGSRSQGFLNVLSPLEAMKDARIFVLSDPKDQEWLKAVSGINDFIDSVVIKPVDPTSFSARVRTALKLRSIKDKAALILDDTVEMKESLKATLTGCGFSRVYETTDSSNALSILKEKAAEITLVVSHWETPSFDGMLLLRKIRQTPKLFDMPFLLVTSARSIEETKAIQLAELSIHGYWVRSSDSEAFRKSFEPLMQKFLSFKRARSVLSEVERYLGASEVGKALELLKKTSIEIPDSPALFEALGDALMTDMTSEEQWKAALSYYESALKLEPFNRSLLQKCSDLYSHFSRIDDWIRVNRAYLDRFAFDEELRIQLAKMYLKKGDQGAAGIELRRILNMNPAHSEAQALLKDSTFPEAHFQKAA